MVPINFDFNLYELKEKIRKEIVNRIMSINTSNYPLDAAWLLYALSLPKKSNNPFFAQGMSELERWALSEESGKKNKDLAPLCLCAFLSTKLEIKNEIIKKAKRIIERSLPGHDMRFNILNDPEQVFCASLLLKNEQSLKKQIVTVIKKNINGRVSRKALFIASLIEFGEDVQGFHSVLKTTENPEDIISLLWLSERYKDIINGDMIDLWKSFDDIYSLVNILTTEDNSTLPSRNLALLYEAIINELNEPDPNMLFDLYPIHPEIKMIARDYFINEKYANAVFEAIKKLKEMIENKVGLKDEKEVELVRKTMNPRKVVNHKLDWKRPEEIIIRFNDYLDELTGKNEQEGLALIAEGIFKAFRHPKGHKPEDHPLLNITPYEALAQLIIIDYIWRRIEAAKINIKGDSDD